MQDISLHILDIAENAIRAGSSEIRIEITEDNGTDKLTVCVEDNGKGMNSEMKKKVLDPFFTTKGRKKVGLGLPLLAQAAQQAGGKLTIDSQEAKGTKVTAVFQLSHPDVKPLGDMVETLTTLVAGNPTTRFIFDYHKDEGHYHFDSFA